MPSLEITVVDNAAGVASYHAQRTYPDCLLASSVWTMVEAVLARLEAAGTASTADPVLISHLRIIGHGSPGRQGMGDSMFTTNTRQLIALDGHGHLLNRMVLQRLRGCFASSAVVELHGCNVGAGRQGANLTNALGELWGIRVVAQAGVQDAGTEGFDHLASLRPHR